MLPVRSQKGAVEGSWERLPESPGKEDSGKLLGASKEKALSGLCSAKQSKEKSCCRPRSGGSERHKGSCNLGWTEELFLSMLGKQTVWKERLVWL